MKQQIIVINKSIIGAVARVWYDPELSEYSVTFRIDGVPCPDLNYFTDDKNDAIGTAHSVLNKLSTTHWSI